MDKKIKLDELAATILSIREAAEELRLLGEDFPAVRKNAERVLASVKMLELNVCDVSNVV